MCNITLSRMSMMLEWYEEKDTSFLSEISADFLFIFCEIFVICYTV